MNLQCQFWFLSANTIECTSKTAFGTAGISRACLSKKLSQYCLYVVSNISSAYSESKQTKTEFYSLNNRPSWYPSL